MKNKSLLFLKKLCMLCMIIVCLCVSYEGCRHNRKPDSDIGSITITNTPSIKGNVELPEMVKLSLYTVDALCTSIVNTTALVPSEDVTPVRIANEVCASMEDSSWYVDIASIETDDDIVIVSFDASSPPIVNVTMKQEGVILDAFAQSLLDNLEQYTKVIFRTDGEAYSSVNRKYSKDYVYMERESKIVGD